MQNNSYKKFGNESEDRAVTFLESQGFVIVERNFYAKKLGEIDIIAKKDNVLHFIEVKSSSNSSYEPIYNITPTKLRRVINSAHYYLKSKKLDMAFCIDALIISGNEIELIENITL
ncbi:MAG: YraN family protein [Campylobacterales bacterium]|nr:YraN family protein [Campylobacterales bacterium]